MMRTLAMAAALAIGLTTASVSPTPAKADVDVDFTLQFDVPSNYKKRGDGWYYQGKYYQLSCGEARRLLRNRGWRNITTRDCNGRQYRFRAWRAGQPREIVVDSRTGRVWRA